MLLIVQMFFLYSAAFNAPLKDKKFKNGIKAVFISKGLCQYQPYVL